MAKRKQQPYIKGVANHRRTESDYMATLLDVVSSIVAAAKQGGVQARA